MSETPVNYDLDERARKPTSHGLLLAWALAQTGGPVLELGGGYGSTPFLHALCGDSRRLVTCENHPWWYEQLRRFEGGQHAVIRVRDWDKLPLLDQRWAVALVDLAPAKFRRVAIERLREHTEYIIAHDWDISTYGPERRILRAYGYDSLREFRYKFVDESARPWTALLSDLRPCDVKPAI